MSETKSAIQSSDLRQKIAAPIAAETVTKVTSSATKYAAKKFAERPNCPSSRAFSAVRRGIHAHETGSAQGVRSRANSLGSPETKTPTVRIATNTQATRASESQRSCKLITRPTFLELFVTILL
jgi:hypothetical protein